MPTKGRKKTLKIELMLISLCMVINVILKFTFEYRKLYFSTCDSNVIFNQVCSSFY